MFHSHTELVLILKDVIMRQISEISLCIFLCLAVAKIHSDSAPKEDLQDEYYTRAPAYTEEFQPSDDRDAQAIFDSDKNGKVMASIFMYRDKIRRNAISQKISALNQKIVDQTAGRFARSRRRSWWIGAYHVPQCQNVFMDLCFSLLFDEKYILAAYLQNFFREKLEKRINIAMVLTKDMQDMIKAYDPFDLGIFKKDRKNQREPFENMLRVWVRQNREPLEKEDIPSDVVKLNVADLKKEQDDGGWHENRDQIELILMKKSIKFARAVIEEFEKLNKGKALEDILIENVKSCDLNENLADTYASLARYIKNKYNYIVRVLSENCDGSDQWAAWMICIAVVHPDEWPKIDELFKKENKGVSLSEFIQQKITTDKILAESIALTVDPKFKPTIFSEIPIDNSPIPPPSESPSPPPGSP